MPRDAGLSVIFETHATSLDNEAGVASGWFDVSLSATGEEQARMSGCGVGTITLQRRATFYALEHLLGRVALHEAVTSSWKWQPGWSYPVQLANTRAQLATPPS